MSEIKYRILLILLNWSFIINISFLYKHILLFLFIKFILNNEYIKFYLIYTNILEVLKLYIQIIYIITNNLSLYFLIYNTFIFFKNGLYKKEYQIIKFKLYLLLTIDIILTLFTYIVLFPIIWIVLNYFQEIFTIKFIQFETKISEYYKIFLNLYILIKYCLFIFIINTLIFKNYINKKFLIKLRKTFIFIIIILILTINEVLLQIICCLFFVVYYELIIWYINFKIYYLG